VNYIKRSPQVNHGARGDVQSRGGRECLVDRLGTRCYDTGMLSRSRLIWGALGLAVSFCLGMLLARVYLESKRVVVDTSRVEHCLRCYIDYRQHQQTDRLKTEIEARGLTMREFEHIIDRLLYYRTNQSSLRHARELLNAYKAGARITANNVLSRSDVATDTVQVDAECIQTIFEQPELVRLAFGDQSPKERSQ